MYLTEERGVSSSGWLTPGLVMREASDRERSRIDCSAD